jgi:hypothetical protein
MNSIIVFDFKIHKSTIWSIPLDTLELTHKTSYGSFYKINQNYLSPCDGSFVGVSYLPCKNKMHSIRMYAFQNINGIVTYLPFLINYGVTIQQVPAKLNIPFEQYIYSFRHPNQVNDHHPSPPCPIGYIIHYDATYYQEIDKLFIPEISYIIKAYVGKHYFHSNSQVKTNEKKFPIYLHSFKANNQVDHQPYVELVRSKKNSLCELFCSFYKK